MDKIEFKLEDYIYDDKSLADFRRRMRHIHSVIRPEDTEVMVCDFTHIKDSDSIGYWVEHWEDKLTCDYTERFEIPVDFVRKNLSDEEIKAKWLELHPEEVEEVPINGIPKVESGSRTVNGSKRKNPGGNMDKIEELLKRLRGDPERCAKCAEDMDYDCPYAGDPDGCNSPTRGRFPVRTDEIADELEEEFKKIGEKLRQQEWVIKKFLGYASVTLTAGFFNADHMRINAGCTSPKPRPRTGMSWR